MLGPLYPYPFAAEVTEAKKAVIEANARTLNELSSMLAVNMFLLGSEMTRLCRPNMLRISSSEAISYRQGWRGHTKKTYEQIRSFLISTNNSRFHECLYSGEVIVEMTSPIDWTQGWAAKAGNIGIEEAEEERTNENRCVNSSTIFLCGD